MTEPSPPHLDRVVVVAGGTGLVGRHVVRALLDAGARVLVPTRRPIAEVEAEVEGLASSAAADRLHLVHVPTWDAPRELLDAAARWRPDAAVASLGGWWIGTELVDLAPDTWRRLVADHLTAHFLAARTLAPLVADGVDPVYLALNGAAAREPMAGSGPVSVAGAGQTMLLDVLRREAIGQRVRFHELAVLAAVAGDERNLDPERTVTGAAVGAAALRVLTEPDAPTTVELP